MHEGHCLSACPVVEEKNPSFHVPSVVLRCRTRPVYFIVYLLEERITGRVALLIVFLACTHRFENFRTNWTTV